MQGRRTLGVAVSRSGGGGDWRAGLDARRAVDEPDGGLPIPTCSGRMAPARCGPRCAAAGVRPRTCARRAARGARATWGLRLGQVEVRQGLGSLGRRRALGVRADAAWAQLRTGAGEETRQDGGAVNQVRAGVEVSRPLRWDNGLSLLRSARCTCASSTATRARRGPASKVAGGTRLAGGRVRVDAQGRLLVLHSVRPAVLYVPRCSFLNAGARSACCMLVLGVFRDVQSARLDGHPASLIGCHRKLGFRFPHGKGGSGASTRFGGAFCGTAPVLTRAGGNRNNTQASEESGRRRT